MSCVYLRQSTASQELILGEFIDDTDGKTPETALSIANTDIKLWKAGATSEVNKNSGGATHIASGRYYIVLDATDTDTVGPLRASVLVSGALPVSIYCTVLEEAVYDAMFAASALGYIANAPVNVAQFGGVNGTFASGIPDVNATATSIRSAVGLASANLDTQLSTIDTVVDSILVDTAEIGVAGAGLTNINLPDQTMNITGDITGNLSGSVGSVTGAVGSVMGNVGGNVTGSIGSLATQAKADVNAEVDAALVDIHLDHLLAADYDPASKPGVPTALLNELIESDAGVSRYTANALEQAPSGGGGTSDWTADERTAIRTILGVPTSGTTPEVPSAGAIKVIDDLIDTEVAAIKAVTDKLDTAVELDGSVYRFTTNALEQAPAGGSGDAILLQETTIATLASQTSFTLTAGSADNDAYNNQTIVFVDQSTSTQKAVGTISDYVGSTRTVTLSTAPAFTIATGDTVKILATAARSVSNLVLPAESTVGTRVNGSTIEVYTSETMAVSITVLDADGDARDLSALTLSLVIENHAGTVLATIADGDITVSGAGNNVATFDMPSAVSDYAGTYRWALRETTDDERLARGVIVVEDEP